MHESSYLRMQYLINYYEARMENRDKQKTRVLDIGSYSVNGSYKSLFDSAHYLYTGLDIEAGPNVDIVPENIYDWKEIEDNTYDIGIKDINPYLSFSILVQKLCKRLWRPKHLHQDIF